MIKNQGKGNDAMRRSLIALFALIAVCGYMEARTIVVEVRNIRSDKGSVLVMAKAEEVTVKLRLYYPKSE